MRVLVLVHSALIPPESTSSEKLAWADWKTEYTVIRSLKKNNHDVRVLGLDDDLSVLQKEIHVYKPHIVFNLLEEFLGRPDFEQHIVSFLELKGIPYTGCGPRGLTICRDKALTKMLLQNHGISTPQFFVASKGSSVGETCKLRFPLIVKSLTEEASLGISQKSIVHNPQQLHERIQFIHESIGTDALVEEYVEGREIYMGIIGNRRWQILTPWELDMNSMKGYPIATRNVKFSKSYNRKHKVSRGPAKDLPPLLVKRLEKICRLTMKSLNLNGYARIDFRLAEDGSVHVLEVNPNAELAKGEDLANAAQHAGISYDDLINKILNMGRKWNSAA